MSLTDRQKVLFLRRYFHAIGHTDGTVLEEATVTIQDIRPTQFNIVSMSEILPMIEYYAKLPLMVDMGYIISPPDKFVYHLLKDLGLIDGFSALAEYEYILEKENSNDSIN